MTGIAGEALTAAAVETIARSGGQLAGRAGGRRPTLPRPPHDFEDSPPGPEAVVVKVYGVLPDALPASGRKRSRRGSRRMRSAASTGTWTGLVTRTR